MISSLVYISLGFQGIVNDDRDIIQTCMLSFYQKHHYQMREWDAVTKVILRSKYLEPTGQGLHAALAEAIDSSRKEYEYCVQALKKKKQVDDPKEFALNIPKMKANLEALRGMKTRTAKGGDFLPPSQVELKEMLWDKRILVNDAIAKDRLRNDGYIKGGVYASTTRPSYSPDGKQAYVMFNIPWSIHSGDVYFFLERAGQKWVLLGAFSKIYV